MRSGRLVGERIAHKMIFPSVSSCGWGTRQLSFLLSPCCGLSGWWTACHRSLYRARHCQSCVQMLWMTGQRWLYVYILLCAAGQRSPSMSDIYQYQEPHAQVCFLEQVFRANYQSSLWRHCVVIHMAKFDPSKSMPQYPLFIDNMVKEHAKVCCPETMPKVRFTHFPWLKNRPESRRYGVHTWQIFAFLFRPIAS